MRKCGIYRITIDRAGDSPAFYIGQSVNIERRRIDHVTALRRGGAKNQRMQRLYDKYGESSFTFETLIECVPDKSILAELEISQMNAQISRTGGDSIVNICRDSMTSCLGVRRSDSTREKQSTVAKLRKPMSDETRRKISETKRARGQKPNIEHMQMLVEMRRGKSISPETKAAMRRANLGKKKSPEEIARRQATRAANKAKVGC